uniref:Uncharacterized protein n=1 Tax=Anopheles culicifacies TaxID=139723 RepID=A0A182MA61_9DIPT
MHIPIKDEYVRDFSFEPEIILRRKDSLDIQRDKYHRKRLNSRRKRLKQNALQVLAKAAPVPPPDQQRPTEPAINYGDAGGEVLEGTKSGSNSETSACIPSSMSNATLIDVSSSDACPPGRGLDDLDPADKEEIRRSIVDIEIEEFYYVSAPARAQDRRRQLISIHVHAVRHTPQQKTPKFLKVI